MSPKRPDDPSIAGDEKLWRRLHPNQLVPRDGGWRPQSGAFIDRNTEELSVDRASLTSLERIAHTYPDHSVAEFTAATVRGLGNGYRVCALPLEDNPAHAVVVPKMSTRDAKLMAMKHCVLVKTGKLPPSRG